MPARGGGRRADGRLADAPILQYTGGAMNEFDLQGLERELQAWWRRVDSPHVAAERTTAVRAELSDIEREIGELRAHPESEASTRARVEKRLLRLLSLYDLACRGRGASA